MDLRDFLEQDAVRFATNVSSKKKLLQDIAEQAHVLFGLDASEILEALTEREKLGSTGVGRGVAIPHARFESLDRVYGFFTRLEKPVDFEAMDHQPVDLVFTILAPKKEGAEHLKALAVVSRTLRAESVCAKLRSNTDETSLFGLLIEQNQSEAA